MARRRILPPAGIGLAALLASCATPHVEPDVDVAGMPNTELALQRSLDRVDRTMGQLGQFGSVAPMRPVVAAELQRPVSLAWTGPLDQGVKALADRIGYRFVVTGPANPAPVEVGVDMTGVPIIDLFRAMGLAAGSNATVVVDPRHRRVEVQHHG